MFGLSSPFVAELSHVWPPLPMLVLAIPAMAAGSLALLLPETAGKSLPEKYGEAMELDVTKASTDNRRTPYYQLFDEQPFTVNI